jgi:hypothetical protein
MLNQRFFAYSKIIRSIPNPKIIEMAGVFAFSFAKIFSDQSLMPSFMFPPLLLFCDYEEQIPNNARSSLKRMKQITKPGGLDVETNRDRDRERP